jgi:carboxypeptidase T
MHHSLSLVLAIGLCSVTATTASAQTLTRVRVATIDASTLAHRLELEGFDVLPLRPLSSGVEVIASDAELRELITLGLTFEEITSGRPFGRILEEREGTDGVPSGYPDLAAVYARMTQAATDHPGICQLVDLTTTYGTAPTFEGRHMMAVKISDNVALDEDEPAVLFASCHHAREVVTPVIALEGIDRLTDDYGAVPSVTEAVNSHEIWIAPVWNPDGYSYVFAVDNMWRKNRRVFANGTGVDQNRNYPHGWDNGCSGSTDPGSQSYKGPGPASEPETQTMLALATDRRFAKMLDFHSSGREALWGYACPTHPFDGFYQNEAFGLSTAASYNGAERPPTADGEHQQWHLGRQGALAFLLETATSFQPSYSSALNEAAQVWGAIEWTLDRDVPLSGHVTDSCSGVPVEATVTPVGVSLTPGETNSSGGAFGRYHAYFPAGSYSVRFEAPGYVTRTLPVDVTASGATILDVALDTAGGSATNYCTTSPNSVGSGATIGNTGSTNVSANDLVLTVQYGPPNQFGLFYYGPNQIAVPFGEGVRCVGGGIFRLHVFTMDGSGNGSYALDIANPPLSAGQISAGEIWNFQCWYRDPAGGPAGFNFSDGREVTFCP